MRRRERATAGQTSVPMLVPCASGAVERRVPSCSEYTREGIESGKPLRRVTGLTASHRSLRRTVSLFSEHQTE
jgi:hypothetical protein